MTPAASGRGRPQSEIAATQTHDFLTREPGESIAFREKVVISTLEHV
jgi:hypothetical protein